MATVPKQLVTEPVSGFPELGPATAIATERVIDVIRASYQRAGYAPLESPLVERTAILSAKASGEIRTQMYGLRLLNPAPGALDDSTSLGLRFDHTVQLARYVAARTESGEFRFPFRRYSIGPVFRGEKPKAGRSRQFTQADIDVIGYGSLSLLHDAEMVGVIDEIFSELGVGPFTIRINDRRLLEGILRSSGCDTEEKLRIARDAIDDMLKEGFDRTVQLLSGIGIESGDARALLESLAVGTTNAETIASLRSRNFDSGFQEGVADLERVYTTLGHMGVRDSHVRIDPSLARGLDYYTGSVFEASLNAHPDLSIAGGGRYDNLAEQFTDKHLPGVGISIGVTRLVARLIREKLLDAKDTTVAPVLVTRVQPDVYEAEYFRIAAELRRNGIGAEIYLADDRFKRQMDFAAKRGFSVVVIAGERELEHHEGEKLAPLVIVRNMRTGDEASVPRTALVESVQDMLARR